MGAELPMFLARLRGVQDPENEVERAFGTMCDRGVKSFVLLCFDDGGVDMIARYLGSDGRRMRGRQNFSLQIVEGADHTFKTLASQRMLRDVLTHYIAAHFP